MPYSGIITTYILNHNSDPSLTMSKKLLLLFLLAILGSVLTSKAATTYTVGDNSGWDISSDLNTWPMDKKFQVGDALMFQYSSSDVVDEVSKQSYEQCNTTSVLKTYSNGNTTVTLDRPGPWYFISGNRLYCLGGMKLAVNVEQDQASSPAGAPQSQPLPQPSSKTDLPSSAGRDALMSSFVCLLALLFWVVRQM